MKSTIATSLFVVATMTAPMAQAETLRLLTWGSYAPEALIKKFEEKYPDIDVEVTFFQSEDVAAQAVDWSPGLYRIRVGPDRSRGVWQRGKAVLQRLREEVQSGHGQVHGDR